LHLIVSRFKKSGLGTKERTEAPKRSSIKRSESKEAIQRMMRRKLTSQKFLSMNDCFSERKKFSNQ
jgi:sRNA-binding carbon storage regulator CsrA